MDPLTENIQALPEDGTAAEAPATDAKTKKRWAEFRQRTEICKTYRKKLIRNWTTNIDYRRGKPFASQTDDDQIAVNLDWSFTKTKHSALFSQVPEVRINHHPDSIQAPWLPAYERKVNDMLKKAGIEAAMKEVLPDCINAAGFGAVLVAMEALTEDKEVPAVDLSMLPPQIAAQVLQTGMIDGQPIEMEVIPEVVARRYTVRRVSPSDFLWPVDFTGSDFDNAPWLGHSGTVTWAEAVTRFGVTEQDKDKILTDEKDIEDRLSHDYDREHLADDGKVGFDEIFYHEHLYDPECKNFESIRHLVFLHGKQEPVIDELWKGQQLGQDGKVLGAQKSPLRVLTLTYVTDEDIPPSDSAIGRAQVNELNKGRTQINKQRERSIPQQWGDINRLDPAIMQSLMKGTQQRIIPVQGDGSKIIGSVEHTPMHQENFMFDRVAKADLQEQWTIGSNQTGTGADVETKGEAGFIQSNFQTKVGMERAQVASFFVGIAQVLGGLIALYEDPASFGEGFDTAFTGSLEFSVLADSTILLDSNQRLERLNNFINTYAKSGYVDIEPVLREVATLIGLDPNVVIRKPEPQEPERPNISLRMTGSEDMMNPLLLAFMIKAGQAPEQQLIEQAKQLIQQSVVDMQEMQQMGAPVPPGLGPEGMPGGPQGGMVPPPPPGMPLPPAPPTPIGGANPEMSLLPSVGKRADVPLPNQGQ